MPLLKGNQHMRANITELNTGEVGKTRAKAIATYAKKNDISEADARFKLSLKIATEYANKK